MTPDQKIKRINEINEELKNLKRKVDRFEGDTLHEIGIGYEGAFHKFDGRDLLYENDHRALVSIVESFVQMKLFEQKLALETEKAKLQKPLEDDATESTNGAS